MTSTGQTPMNTAAHAASAWVLDPTQTAVKFHTKAMWVLKVTGSAKALEGVGTVDADGAFSGTLVIDAATIDTGNKKRDDHLRTADFLDTERYPTITFAATSSSQASPGTFEVVGTLTVHGQTRPLTVSADVRATGDTAIVSTEVDIDRSQWGVSWSKMGANLMNHVVISAHFVKVTAS